MTIHSGKEFALFNFGQVEFGHVLFFFLVMAGTYPTVGGGRDLYAKWDKKYGSNLD